MQKYFSVVWLIFLSVVVISQMSPRKSKSGRKRAILVGRVGEGFFSNRGLDVWLIWNATQVQSLFYQEEGRNIFEELT